MKNRKLLTVIAVVLAILMMGSAFATIITLVVGAEEKTFNTSTPTYLCDLTTDAVHSSFANMSSMVVDMGDGYTTFKATADDPYTWIQTPTCKPCEAQYAVIRYRTTAQYKGEFFCTRSDNGAMGSGGTNQQWTWNASGEWETIVISMDAWKNAKDSVTFSIFRFDPLQGGVKAGSTIDVQYYAFFATEEDAKGFNFDEYKAKLAYEEEQKRAEEEIGRAHV